MLTPRENILAVFRQGTPEWIPLVTHVDPYNQPNREGMSPDLAEAMGTVRWCDENTVRLSRYLSLDIMDYMSEPVRIHRKNVTVESTRKGDDTIDAWHTPQGTLTQVRRRCRDDGTSYVVEHLIKSASDLPVLAAIFEDESLTLDTDIAVAMRKRQELIGNDGILQCFIPGTPMGLMYRVYSGVETLAYLYHDAPQALRDLFTVMETNYQTRLKISLEAPADAYVGMDDTSTTVVSPAMFEACSLDLTDRRADICHEADKLYFHHSCGLIRDLLPLYRRTRMDAVHAFTEPPIGNVTIVDGRKLLGDKIAIRGGVAAMAEGAWEPEAMRKSVCALLTGITLKDRVALSITAYPHKTIDQMKAVVEACRTYRDVQDNAARGESASVKPDAGDGK